MLISFGPWAFQRLTHFIKSQIDSALPKNAVTIHYHQVGTGDPEDDQKTQSYEELRLETRDPDYSQRSQSLEEMTHTPPRERLNFSRLLN